MLSFAILFANCTTPRYAYSPSAHNVPILAKKQDSKFAAAYSNNLQGKSTDDNNSYSKNNAGGFDLQGAYAITNHIAVQADYFYRKENNSSSHNNADFDTSNIRYKRSLFELGAGFFSPLDTKDKILFQFYAGAGFGKTTIGDNGIDQNFLPYSRYYNTNITKYYLEPSVTFRAKEIFAASVATRVSFLKYRNINTNYTLQERQDFNLDSLNRFAIAFFEPAFVGSLGFNKVPGFRIEFQTGLSILWEEDFIDYRPFNFSIGLVFDIGKLIKSSGSASDN